MKFLTPILVLFVGLTAMAQNNAYLDPARRAEIDARNNAYGPGYLTPGNIDQPGRPYMPPRPPMRPPMPPPPPAPGYGDIGPQMTVRWQDNG